MITRKTALQEAGRLAAALDGPLGRRPMQRVIYEFLPLFRGLRESGASWSQIGALLASRGVRSRSGQVLSDGVLRAMVSRAERQTLVNIGAERAGSRDLSAPHVGGGDRHSPRPLTKLKPPHAASLVPMSDISDRIMRASVLRSVSGGAERD